MRHWRRAVGALTDVVVAAGLACQRRAERGSFGALLLSERLYGIARALTDYELRMCQSPAGANPDARPGA